MELKRVIRSGVSAPPCQHGECHGQATLGWAGVRQRTCGLFDPLDDVWAGRKHKAEPLAVESGHDGEFDSVVAGIQQSVDCKVYAQYGFGGARRGGWRPAE